MLLIPLNTGEECGRGAVKYSRVSKGSWTGEQGRKVEGTVEISVFRDV
jgi:hypothetical protein